MADPRLKGGRGPKLGPDGNIIQDESYDVRRLFAPLANAWLLSNDEPYAIPDFTVTLLSLTDVYLSWASFAQLRAAAEITKARIVVTGAAAGTLYTGIYAYNEQTLEVVLVPGSLATFSTASAVLVDADVKCRLAAEGRYLIGFLGTSGAVMYRGTPSGNSRSVPSYVYPATELPTRFLLSQATKSYSSELVSVTYLSAQAARVL